MEVPHNTSDPRSGKQRTLNEEDDDDDVISLYVFIISTPTGYEQSRALIGSSTTRISAHIPWVEKVKMAERFAQPTKDEIKSLIENKTPKNTKKATKFGMKVFDGKKDISCISNDYLDRFLPKLYCLCCYLLVCLQPSRRLIINSFCDLLLSFSL